MNSRNHPPRSCLSRPQNRAGFLGITKLEHFFLVKNPVSEISSKKTQTDWMMMTVRSRLVFERGKFWLRHFVIAISSPFEFLNRAHSTPIILTTKSLCFYSWKHRQRMRTLRTMSLSCLALKGSGSISAGFWYLSKFLRYKEQSL